MNLGAFSISLTVKDVRKSMAFYEVLGFRHFHGEPADGWVLLKNRDHIIGLFHGMFDKNMLTFNPGWDQNGQATEERDDVRDIQKALKAAGIDILQVADESTTGPARVLIEDPDGNPVLLDQHI